ncbi:MAG: hypothetical protein WC975_02605 [Phycisphaerae bacterium]
MNRRLTVFFFIASILTLCILAGAQQVALKPNLTDENLWTDATYYLKIGRMEYGKAYLQAYLDRKVDPAKTLEFSEKDPRSVQILTRLQSDPQLGKEARAALDQIDKGWQIRRRDLPRINDEIERLTGTPRAQFQATERLKEAGEYSVPILLGYLENANRPALHSKIIDALVALGPSAIEPLLAAVVDLPDAPKRLVINALGRLDYPQSIPYLKEVIENEKIAPTVSSAAKNALESILTRNPKYRTDVNAAGAFYALALRYYYHDSTITPAGDISRLAGFSGDVAAEKPNVWLMRDGKLVPQGVAWEIYYELMAMRLTRRSLQLETTAGLQPGLTLWLMADCKRESKLSSSIVDPLHAKDFPTAGYFFRCAGTSYGLDALLRSLNDDNIVCAVKSLESLREVASGNDILAAFGECQPIVNALNSKNQLIRTYAALALGWTAPADKYPGMDQVVPLLGRILVAMKNPAAVLIIPDKEKLASVSTLVKALGFEVKEAGDFQTALKVLNQAPGQIESIVLDYNLATPGANLAIDRLRDDPLLKLVPVVVLVSSDRLADATTVLGRRAGVAVVPDTATQETIGKKIDYLRQQLGRVALSKEDFTQNALLSVLALERLARTKLPQYNVERVRDKLNEAMNGSDWTLALESAKTLSLLAGDAAQKNLADAAIGRKEPGQKVSLLNLLTDSVRSFGNKLNAKQVGELQSLVISESDSAIRQATAKVLGALNLEPQVAKKVILAKDPFGSAK